VPFVTDLLLLNTKEPFVNQLVGVLANQMGEFFPEIKSQQQLVKCNS
jgi:alanyl-tRNA synthetase